MTNASSAYLGIIIGAIIGGFISWLIYSRQKHTSNKQDDTLGQIKQVAVHQEKTLEHIKNINEHQEDMLETIKDSEKRLESMLSMVMDLSKRTDLLVERQAGFLDSSKARAQKPKDQSEKT